MLKDSDYSASEYRRFTQDYPAREVNKSRKFKWFLAATSILLMVSMGWTIYVYHFEIILTPFRWALMIVSAHLLFFLLGMAVALINVSPEFKD